jgi:hypothetical protein
MFGAELMFNLLREDLMLESMQIAYNKAPAMRLPSNDALTTFFLELGYHVVKLYRKGAGRR